MTVIKTLSTSTLTRRWCCRLGENFRQEQLTKQTNFHLVWVDDIHNGDKRRGSRQAATMKGGKFTWDRDMKNDSKQDGEITVDRRSDGRETLCLFIRTKKMFLACCSSAKYYQLRMGVINTDLALMTSSRISIVKRWRHDQPSLLTRCVECLWNLASV